MPGPHQECPQSTSEMHRGQLWNTIHIKDLELEQCAKEIGLLLQQQSAASRLEMKSQVQEFAPQLQAERDWLLSTQDELALLVVPGDALEIKIMKDSTLECVSRVLETVNNALGIIDTGAHVIYHMCSAIPFSFFHLL
jgi:hypothetical protein